MATGQRKSLLELEEETLGGSRLIREDASSWEDAPHRMGSDGQIRKEVGPVSADRQRDVDSKEKSSAEVSVVKTSGDKDRAIQRRQGPAVKVLQRAPRRRGQQPKLLNSPEDSLYYNQLNRTLDYQGSKRKPRKLGQIKLLDGEDEYYKLLSTAESIPEEDLSSSPHPLHSPPPGPAPAPPLSRGALVSQS